MATFDWEQEIDSEAGEREFVNFDEDTGEIVLSFEEDDPRVRQDKKYDKPRYTFRVDSDKLFSTMSTRFMTAIMPFRPLRGKTLGIKRSGLNYETDYEVAEVKE